MFDRVLSMSLEAAEKIASGLKKHRHKSLGGTYFRLIDVKNKGSVFGKGHTLIKQ